MYTYSNEGNPDPALLTIGLTQTCFEGSMYLFVFAWVPSLQEVAAPEDTLPLGYIFSAFMVSMMLGSVVYSVLAKHDASTGSSQTRRPEDAKDNSLTLHAKLSSLVCLLSAFALAISVSSREPHHRFWAFCLFEACVGMYYPVQGMLRGVLISNDHRATVRRVSREVDELLNFTHSSHRSSAFP